MSKIETPPSRRLPGLLKPTREPLVYRSVSLTVSAFDHLKDYQRRKTVELNRCLDNNQTLSLLILEHKQFIEESGEHRERHRI